MVSDSKNRNLLLGKNMKETVKNGVILGSLLAAVSGFTKIYKKVSDENREREIYKLRFGTSEKKESPVFKLFNSVKERAAGIGEKAKENGGIFGAIGALVAMLFGGSGPFKTIFKILSWVGKGVWAIIKVVSKVLWKVVKWVLPKLWKFIQWVGKLLGKALGKLWSLIKGPILKMFGKLTGILKKGISIIKDVLGKLFGKMFGKFGKMFGKLGGKLSKGFRKA